MKKGDRVAGVSYALYRVPTTQPLVAYCKCFINMISIANDTVVMSDVRSLSNARVLHRTFSYSIHWRYVCVALECPRLVLPSGVSIEECPRRPVYGDVCIVRCSGDMSSQSSSRRLRSCEVKNYNTVYWTGQFPQCSG